MTIYISFVIFEMVQKVVKADLTVPYKFLIFQFSI